MEETKKRTGNVTTTSEVELQPKTRDRKASRNRGQISTTKILPCTNLKDYWGRGRIFDGLEWRVKWGSVG